MIKQKLNAWENLHLSQIGRINLLYLLIWKYSLPLFATPFSIMAPQICV